VTSDRPTSVRSLLDKIDIARLREIQKRHAGSSDRYSKYSDVERWLKINLDRARDLKLDRSPPQTILDLGCGAGFFLFVAKQLGHSVLGIDVDDFAVPNELTQLFQIERKVWRIRAFQPLPDLGRKFDLITAFSTAFNRNDDESLGWGWDEWNFFLRDLDRHRKSDGRMFFEINSGKDNRYFPPPVRQLFLSRGATIDGEFVRFSPAVSEVKIEKR
jgi:SAM-dependent methyltransferase